MSQDQPFSSKLGRIFIISALLIALAGLNHHPAQADSSLVQIRVSQGTDDAEEQISDGTIDLESSDLELIRDGSNDQIVGMRFQNVRVPVGATILNAYLEFETDETGNTNPSTLIFQGQNTDNPATFASNAYNISNRPQTSASVTWSPETWSTTDEKHQTPDLSIIVQEIIEQVGWSSGNAMVFFVTGEGCRIAESYNGEDTAAPLLVIDYTMDPVSIVTFQQDINSYPDTVDTYLQSDVPTANNAITNTLIVELNPEHQILLRFDEIFGSGPGQIPFGATIQSAILEINVTNESTQGARLHRMLQAWEDTDNWNAWNEGVNNDGIEATVTAINSNGSGTGLTRIDVTSDLQAWVDGEPNFGWAWLPPTENNSWQFDSAEGSIPPKLKVAYSTGPAISISGTPLNTFKSEPGELSEEQSYTITGRNLSEDIVITSPPDFEVSTTSGSGFSTSLTLPQSGGTVPATMIYIHFYRPTRGNASGEISHTSAGAITRNVTANGQTNYFPTIVSFQNGVSGYAGVIDTFIREGNTNADTNFSTETTLEWDDNSSTTDEVTFIRFNDIFSSTGGLIPEDATIISATLQYRLDSSISAGGDDADVYENLINWPEDSVTWNNFGGDAGVQTDEYENLITSAPAGSTDTTYTIDVTASLQRWASNPTSNLGWVFLPTDDDGAMIHSSETDTIAYRPCLTVAYRTEPVNIPPNPPIIVQPMKGATGISIPTTLEIIATDPNTDTLNITFYGRPVITTTPGADFSLVALPDTQHEAQDYPAAFISQTQWISDNMITENIAFATHLGDIVNIANSHPQWQNADDAMSILDFAEVPYSVGPGNHDLPIYVPETYYSEYFGIPRFAEKSWYGGYYDDDNFNNYSLFSASGLDFIIVNLQYDPDTAALDWADALLKVYPDRRGIIESHNILNPDNSWSNQEIYTALEDNPNLFLMLCGHMHQENDGAAQRAETGSYGNTIYVLMSDYQDYENGGNGYLRIMHFSPVSNTINVKTYSPYVPEYLTDPENQFTLTYNMNEGHPFEIIGIVNNVTSGSNASIAWNGLTSNTEYEWYPVVSDGELATIGEVNRFYTGDYAFADSPSDGISNCTGNMPCFTSIQSAIDTIGLSGTVFIYGGEYDESIILNKNVPVSISAGGAITLTGSFTQELGTFTATDAIFTILGDFIYTGNAFDANGGTIAFNSGTTQTLTLNTPIVFNNLTIGIGTNLLETISVDNATIDGSLNNHGMIRKTQSVVGVGPLTFGLTEVQMDISNIGSLSSLTIDRIDQNHSAAASTNMQTGRYWDITAFGEGYSVNLTFPHNSLTDPKVCRYLDGTGSGAGYDCASSNNTATVVTRNGVTSFSEWTVGEHVNPTVINLQQITSQSTISSQNALLIGMIVLLIWSTLLARKNMGT